MLFVGAALGHVDRIFWITPLVWLLSGWLFGQEAPARGAAVPTSFDAAKRPSQPR